MLEYIPLRDCKPSNGILDKCRGPKLTVKLTVKGRVLMGKARVSLPELIVAISKIKQGIRAVSIDGNLYSITYNGIVTKEDIPEPIVNVKHIKGYSFAIAEGGTVYYNVYHQGWSVLTGVYYLTQVISDSKYSIYIFADGWYNVFTNIDDEIVALPIHPRVQDIMIEGDEVSMLIDGKWYCI